MFICGVITILGAVVLLSSASSDSNFIPIPNTPKLGELPLNNIPATYNVTKALVGQGIDPNTVEEILIYVFFTGLGGGSGPATRAYYEIYTNESENGQEVKYAQFFNAVFDQPNTVINSENLWFPFTPNGNLYAQKIVASSRLVRIMSAAAKQRSVDYKTLYEAWNAYTQQTNTIFRDVFLIGYSESDDENDDEF